MHSISACARQSTSARISNGLGLGLYNSVTVHELGLAGSKTEAQKIRKASLVDLVLVAASGTLVGTPCEQSGAILARRSKQMEAEWTPGVCFPPLAVLKHC